MARGLLGWQEDGGVEKCLEGDLIELGKGTCKVGKRRGGLGGRGFTDSQLLPT